MMDGDTYVNFACLLVATWLYGVNNLKTDGSVGHVGLLSGPFWSTRLGAVWIWLKTIKQMLECSSLTLT